MSKESGEMMDVQSLFIQGIELVKQEKFSEAEQAFRKVKEIHPDSATALKYLEFVLTKQEKYLEAEHV